MPSWRRQKMPRKGDIFGDWKLIRRIGEGGNGVVWKASNTAGDFRAIKLFVTSGVRRQRFARFKDEISFLIGHPDRTGVLGLIDSEVHDNQSRLSWYVMPIARPITEALGSNAPPAAVISTLASIAETLADLADEGIWHRDLKPDNLFELDGEWLIGDFGLVAYPQKKPVTRHNERVGPIDYMAPEMRRNVDASKAGPADVWSLAKTVWVLLTGETAPLPGPHRPDDPSYSIRSKLRESGFDRTGEIDLLMERATRIEPAQRESMRGLARELRAAVALPPERLTPVSLDDLSERIAALTMPETQRIEQSQDWAARVDRTYGGLEALLTGVFDELKKLLPSFQATPDYYPISTFTSDGFVPTKYWGSWSQGRKLYSPGLRVVTLLLSITASIGEVDGPVSIAARFDLEYPSNMVIRGFNLWSGEYEVPVGSAQQAEAFNLISAGFRNAFELALRLSAQALAAECVLSSLPDERYSVEVRLEEVSDLISEDRRYERSIE